MAKGIMEDAVRRANGRRLGIPPECGNVLVWDSIQLERNQGG